VQKSNAGTNEPRKLKESATKKGISTTEGVEGRKGILESKAHVWREVDRKPRPSLFLSPQKD